MLMSHTCWNFWGGMEGGVRLCGSKKMCGVARDRWMGFGSEARFSYVWIIVRS